MNKLAQLERDNYVRGVIDTIDNLDAPLSVKLASVDLLLTKEAGIAEDVRQKAKDLLARGKDKAKGIAQEIAIANELRRGKMNIPAANMVFDGGADTGAALGRRMQPGIERVVSAPAASPGILELNPNLAIGKAPPPSTVGMYEELLSRPLSPPAAAQAALPGGGGPLVPVGGGPLVPRGGGGPLVPVGGGGPLVPVGGRSMMAVPEAESAASGLGRFLPKTRLGKAGLGVAGLGALGLGANYLMGEDEPASFYDRLMSGDLSPEEMAALGLGGAALGTGAYYAGRELL